MSKREHLNPTFQNSDIGIGIEGKGSWNMEQDETEKYFKRRSQHRQIGEQKSKARSRSKWCVIDKMQHTLALGCRGEERQD